MELYACGRLAVMEASGQVGSVIAAAQHCTCFKWHLPLKLHSTCPVPVEICGSNTMVIMTASNV